MNIQDKIDACTKPPSKGGIPIAELKMLAMEMGIDIKNKNKSEICDEIRAKLIEQSKPKTKIIKIKKIVHMNDAKVDKGTQSDVILDHSPSKVIKKIIIKKKEIVDSQQVPIQGQHSSFSTIRVGQRQMRKSYPSAPDYVQIPAWSKGKGIYKELSPFYLGPIEYDGQTALTFENLWQYLKVYKDQVDGQNDPTNTWYAWRNAGFSSPTAERHPRGKEVPLYNYFNGKKLGVTEARRQVYIPYYKALIRKTQAYKDLLSRFKAGEKLLLIEPDGPSLQDFPEGIPFSRELFQKLIDITDQRSFYSLIGKPYPYPGNRYFPLGHGYVLADALLEDVQT